MNFFKNIILPVFCALLLSFNISAQENKTNILSAKLFAELLDYCPTPDAFDIAPDGSLTLSCPNYADRSKPGVLMSITKDGQVSKLIDVPVLEQSGISRPMGIAYDKNGALYVCDNQGNKGRLLKLTFEEKSLIRTEVIAYDFNSINGIKSSNTS